MAPASVAHILVRHLRIGGLVVGLAIGPLVVACGDESSDPSWVQELSAESTEEFELSTETSASPAATASVPDTGGAPTSSVEVPPTVLVTGSDLDAVWRSMQAYEEWVLSHPDPALLGAIYLEGTEIHRQSAELVGQLRSDGAHMVVGDYEIGDIEIVEQRPGESARLRYEDSRSYREVIDGRGVVVEREEYEDQPWTWELTLEVDDEGRWQIAAIEFVASD